MPEMFRKLCEMIPPVRMLSQEDIDAIGAVVCCPATWPSPFPDQAYGWCSKCQRAVQFRPDVPGKPPKICLPCYTAWMEKEMATETNTEALAVLERLKTVCLENKRYDPPRKL